MKKSKNPFDKLDHTIEVNTPTQKIVSASDKVRKRDFEKPYTLYLDKDLLEKLKLYAFKNKTNMKEVVHSAIISFFENKS